MQLMDMLMHILKKRHVTFTSQKKKNGLYSQIIESLSVM